MPNQPLPEITCKHCNKIQTWTYQTHCKSCGALMSNWSVASQLATQPAPWNIRKPEFTKDNGKHN